MESRVIEPRNIKSPMAFVVASTGAKPTDRESEIWRRGRGRRAGQTTGRETMKHGRSAILQGINPGIGRYRETTPPSSCSQTATNELKYEKKAVSPGTRGEVEPSRRGRNRGSLSAPIVLIENRRTGKRQEPGSREGGRPRVGTDAGIHTLHPPRK